ncbi:hypothetical protein [Candidatus Vondammii sp. HM_W22]
MIESITENQNTFFKDGTPKRIEFRLELRKDEDSKSNCLKYAWVTLTMF